MGRGREDPRRVRDPAASTAPIAQFDYGFLGLGEGGAGRELAAAVGEDRGTGCLVGVVIEAKGDPISARMAVSEFLDGLGYLSMGIHERTVRVPREKLG